ncbi:MAG: nuclear transport factor 2 family protein [Gammaproteobacteria bacterium]|nr:nuclear transport factor 2 family protein [Gammaproteobacteria bacterium]NNC98046.1 nuclear transport factor 2 family protein [Gammaproteobacteria bacterium]NNM13675.1 nuclear transport factor 2 family protein [Gammaproteobacteria bacterium]
MTTLHPSIQKWFDVWESGKLEELPVTDDFSHTSPFGTIAPKSAYLEIVSKNRAEFLGNVFTILDQIQEGNKLVVRYDLSNKNTGLEMRVCECYELEGDLINEIHAYYNIGNAEIKA